MGTKPKARKRRATRRFETNLAKLREEAKLTQQEAAHRAEISQSYYQWLERGFCMPSLDVSQRVAKALGVGVSRIECKPLRGKAVSA